MTVWRMRLVFWIPKPTNTHSGYVILTAFQQQQWLHELAPLLRYTYSACRVITELYSVFLRGTRRVLVYNRLGFDFISNWKPLTKRSQGRPKYRWEDNIKQDICQVKIKNWTACVQDREKWKKEVVEKAKTFSN